MTSSDVLGSQLKVTLCRTPGVPVPAIGTLALELIALLTKVNAPVALPGDAGLKVRIREAVRPEGIVIGSDIPLVANSALLIVAEDSVIGPPAAKSVFTCFWVLPTATFPKLIAVELTLSSPGKKAVPASMRESLGLEAFDSIASLPQETPLELGA